MCKTSSKIVKTISKTANSKTVISIPINKRRYTNGDMVNNRVKKKCWVCYKPNCWSTNYLASEIEESKKKFGSKDPEYKKRVDYKHGLS